jgi:hypothetical protein
MAAGKIQGASQALLGRRWFSIALAALALVALVALVATRADGAEGAVSLEGGRVEEHFTSVQEMLAMSKRLQAEGRKFPTFDVPSTTSDRIEDMGQQKATSGEHALDWRKGRAERIAEAAWKDSGDAETPLTTEREAYIAPAGPIDQVDDPVGDKEGWVTMSDRAFRVARRPDGSLDHLDVPGDAKIRAVADGWEVDIPDSKERVDYRQDRDFIHHRLSRFTGDRRKELAENRLRKKFYNAEQNENSRRDPAWSETPSDMDTAGWNSENSAMPIRAGRGDPGDEDSLNSDKAGTRDIYYHWVARDGRTDGEGPGPAEEQTRPDDQSSILQANTEDDSKPKWLVVRQDLRDGTIKIERDANGGIEHVAVPASAKVAPASSGWKISLPVQGASLQSVKSASSSVDKEEVDNDPLNDKKVEAVTPQWSSVSAPGDLPGESATVRIKDDSDAHEIDGQAIDRAAYGISPSTNYDKGEKRIWGESNPRSTADASPRKSRGLAAPKVRGKWHLPADRKPVVDVYQPNTDPFYCADGSEASICGTEGYRKARHDYSLGWNGMPGAERDIAREQSRDRAGELGQRPSSGGPSILEKMEGKRSPYRETPASGDPYRYVRDGKYAKILKLEDDIVGQHGESTKTKTWADWQAQGQDTKKMMKAMGAAKGEKLDAPEQYRREDTVNAGTGRTVPPLPYKVRAPYDGSLIKIGYPNMRGGMRSEDGALLPYDDRSGTGNNIVTNKQWASDVWRRPSFYGTRDVRDSVNRNEEGGAARLVDEGGFHEYEAGNNGFHESRPYDPHDDWDSDESRKLNVDQFDIVGDEEGRRRAARGGDGNADEFDSSRMRAKSDYEVDEPIETTSHENQGEEQHVYVPFSNKAAWGEADLADDVKRRAALRIAERAHRRSDSEAIENDDERRDTRLRDSRRSWDEEEGAMGWAQSEPARSSEQDETREDRREKEQAGRREHEYEERFRSLQTDDKLGKDSRLMHRWSRRAARDARRAAHSSLARLAATRDSYATNGHLAEERVAPLSSSEKAAQARFNELAAAKLAEDVSRRRSNNVEAPGSERQGEEHVNEVAARKLAVESKLASRNPTDTAAAGGGKRGLTTAIADHIRSWLGVYERHKPLPARTTILAGVDAVDDYNRKALEHVLVSAKGGDSDARLVTRKAIVALRQVEHPKEAQLKRRFVCCLAHLSRPGPCLTCCH